MPGNSQVKAGSAPALAPITAPVALACAKATKPKDLEAHRDAVSAGAISILALVRLEGVLLIGPDAPAGEPTLRPAVLDVAAVLLAVMHECHVSVNRAADLGAAYTPPVGEVERLRTGLAQRALALLAPVSVAGSAGRRGSVSFSGSALEVIGDPRRAVKLLG
jgi:hypothetical protein